MVKWEDNKCYGLYYLSSSVSNYEVVAVSLSRRKLRNICPFVKAWTIKQDDGRESDLHIQNEDGSESPMFIIKEMTFVV